MAVLVNLCLLPSSLCDTQGNLLRLEFSGKCPTALPGLSPVSLLGRPATHNAGRKLPRGPTGPGPKLPRGPTGPGLHLRAAACCCAGYGMQCALPSQLLTGAYPKLEALLLGGNEFEGDMDTIATQFSQLPGLAELVLSGSTGITGSLAARPDSGVCLLTKVRCPPAAACGPNTCPTAAQPPRPDPGRALGASHGIAHEATLNAKPGMSCLLCCRRCVPCSLMTWVLRGACPPAC